jgi:hypothetical protein
MLFHPALSQRRRKILQAVLASPITVTPRVEAGVLYFDLAWKAGYGDLDLDLHTDIAVIQQDGQEVTGRVARRGKRRADCRVQKGKRWCPRGDSNTRHAV